MKVVICKNYGWGGFRLSEEAMEFYHKKHKKLDKNFGYKSFYEIERNDPILVETVEKLGKLANPFAGELVVQEIPNEYHECDAWEVVTLGQSEYVKLDHNLVELVQLRKENKELRKKINKLQKNINRCLNCNEFCTVLNNGLCPDC